MGFYQGWADGEPTWYPGFETKNLIAGIGAWGELLALWDRPTAGRKEKNGLL